MGSPSAGITPSQLTGRRPTVYNPVQLVERLNTVRGASALPPGMFVSNAFVGVVAGSLFQTDPEFHLQASVSFRMPEIADATAYSEASAYWAMTAPFFGLPFKRGITDKQIFTIFSVLCGHQWIPLITVPIPSATGRPGIVLVGCDPVTIASAINTCVDDTHSKEGEGRYAKFGYAYAATGHLDYYPASKVHAHVSKLLRGNETVRKMLEVRQHMLPVPTSTPCSVHPPPSPPLSTYFPPTVSATQPKCTKWIGEDGQEELYVRHSPCWLQPFPGQILLAGELCWTAHKGPAYGVVENLDHELLKAKMR